MATILAVDDDPDILGGLELSIERAGHVALIAESAYAALEVLRAQPVDVVVADERMPGMSGTELLADVRMSYPAVVRILLTGHGSLDTALRAINEGRVFAFLQKPCRTPHLAKTLEAAVQHAAVQRLATATQQGPDTDAVDSKTPSLSEPAERAARELPGIPAQELSQLSPRELEVLSLLITGQRVAHIARQLFISPHTVRNHLRSIFRKLDVRSQADLIARASGTANLPPAHAN